MNRDTLLIVTFKQVDQVVVHNTVRILWSSVFVARSIIRIFYEIYFGNCAHELYQLILLSCTIRYPDIRQDIISVWSIFKHFYRLLLYAQQTVFLSTYIPSVLKVRLNRPSSEWTHSIINPIFAPRSSETSSWTWNIFIYISLPIRSDC